MDIRKRITICDDEIENRKHMDAIDILAGSLDITIEEMLSTYKRELEKMNDHAKIREYLSIIVARKVRLFYRK